jgi:hypothetical protein
MPRIKLSQAVEADTAQPGPCRRRLSAEHAGKQNNSRFKTFHHISIQCRALAHAASSASICSSVQCFSSIALRGHALTHIPHPLQSAGSMKETRSSEIAGAW